MKNFLEMSDEDFAKAPPPDASEAGGEGEQGAGAGAGGDDSGAADTTTTQTQGDNNTAGAGSSDGSAAGGGEGTSGENQNDEGNDDDAGTSGAGKEDGDASLPGSGAAEGDDKSKNPAGKPAATADQGGDKSKSPNPAGDQKDGGKPAGADTTATAGAETPPDYKALYEKLMAPFKANGKTIQLKSFDEVLSLMQMGANYTRKMQDIQPHRKLLMMLENNGLMNETELSYLIDLQKKNPEAIKKLLKDSKMNPMDIDVEAESTYKPGNHQVSDSEVAFNTVLEDVSSSDAGKETIRLMNTAWDTESKQALWKEPQIMAIIHAQRESGVYDRISAEVDRQKTIGAIPANTPFLQAYKAVGEYLDQQGALKDLQSQQSSTAHAGAGGKPAAVVATKVIPPKTQVKKDPKADAASTTRSAPKPAKTIVNPLSMSDDDFIAQMSNRL